MTLQLKDQSLFIEKAYVNGEWVEAQSGKTFEVHGTGVYIGSLLKVMNME
jgi:succinate-semialdehyde dehydrogenase/glutarate-semialdehyde dehydrogenase